ncbi:MAG: glycosyltransferase family 2 protein [Bacteroidota bacterium]
MQDPKVSILIPFKNTEKYLSECLDSILAQTYSNWEVIAVDDASQDSSFELVSNYTKKDPRIQVLKNTGNGVIPALQTAYSNCIGQYITRMDSDDVMLAKRLQVMVESLQKHGLGYLAVGQVNYFSENGIGNGYRKYEIWLNALTKAGTNYLEIYKECVIPSPCWMVSKADFEKCGGFNSNRYPEDYDLAFRFYENGLNVIPCDEVLHQWRDYDHRASRTSEHYKQNYFLDIKLDYFVKLDYQPNKQLVLWGAGSKGKEIAKKLQQKSLDFVWLCDNQKKIGTKIYGHTLYHFSKLCELHKPQSIITVANENEQKEIKSFLASLDYIQTKDYFFFC